MENVFVTGMGVLCPLGRNLGQFEQALAEGRRGLRFFEGVDNSFSRCRLAGQVDLELQPGENRLAKMAELAAQEALDLADWKPEGAEPKRCAVFVSSSKGGIETFESKLSFDWENYYSHQPGALLRHKLGWKGGGGNYPLACATGGYSIGAGMQAIQEGRLDAALVGSTEASLTRLVWRSFDGLGVLAPCVNAEELKGPFDQERAGFVLGEGAAVLLLESENLARRRGAKPLALLAGFACTCDASHFVSPDPKGRQAARCLDQALAAAGVGSKELDYLNAHGTGTKIGDQAEAHAIQSTLGKGSHTGVSSTKGATGHLLGAAGSVEAVASLLALKNQWMPATLGVDKPMELGFELLRGRKAISGSIRTAASLNMGFGGHNVALVFKRV